ncbi:MAG: class I SAM-dependent methyltransferase [Ignavibacteria bacterium]|nr:class I SAM-dependent methyltransferase [Ignavibacteria bacterium]
MHNAPDQVPENWSSIAQDYELAFEQLSKQYATEAVTLLRIDSSDTVLDVAAGTGAFSLLAAATGARVLATDFAEGMVNRIRERAAEQGADNITCAVMDGQSLDVPNASHTVSASALGLIFFPDIGKGIDELYRVLKPGGRCAIICWSSVERMPLMTIMVQALKLVIPDFPTPSEPPLWARLLGPEALATAMETAGFVNVKIETTTKPLTIHSPEKFWSGFVKSSPPMIKLMSSIGPETAAEVGRAYTDLLRERETDGAITLLVDACIGVGEVPK